MAEGRRINVQFPLGGENRRGGYAQKTQPFTSPRAINVRSVGPLEKRGRGGSRPGFKKFLDYSFGSNNYTAFPVSYIDTDGAHQHKLVVIEDGDQDGNFDAHLVTVGSRTAVGAFLTDDSGNYIIADNDDYIVLPTSLSLVTAYDLGMAQKGGKLYVNDGASLLELDLRTGSARTITGHPTNADAGRSLPMCVYNERLVMLGSDHMWYMSAVDDVDDWSYAKDKTLVTRAVSGRLGGSEIGDTCACVVPYETHQMRALLMGTQDSLWVMYGNPAGGGRLECVSRNVGPLTKKALTVTTDGLVVFLSKQGVYTWQIGSKADPEPFSKHKVPEELMDTAVAWDTFTMFVQYDRRRNCVYILEGRIAIPSSTVGWWLDLEHRAMWRMELPATMRPHGVATMRTSGDSDVIWACSDGYLRRFDNDELNDDGTAITSDLLLGPFSLANEEGYTGSLEHIAGTLATGSGPVTWNIIVRDSAEEAVDDAVAAQGGDSTVTINDSGIWHAGANRLMKLHTRGAWAVVWLSATQPWAYGSAAIKTRKRGRYL